jgi:hypothetical protein
MKTIVVIATWSSGSSALTGYLERCGAYSCPPHLETSDPRTPVSYEPLKYQEQLTSLFDENSLRVAGDPQAFKAFFEDWWTKEHAKAQNLDHSHIVLKHPLQCLILPYLDKKLDAQYVFLTRPLDKIEATRTRRKWPRSFGAAGAQLLYSAAFKFFVAQSRSYLSVSFDDFRKDPKVRFAMLDYLELKPVQDKLDEAERFIRQ